MSSTRFAVLTTLTALAVPGLSQAQAVTVREGDTLSIIARAQLGDVGRWRALCAFNQEVIGDDCNTIRPGMRLRLPGPDYVAPASVGVVETPEPEPEETVEEPVAEETPAVEEPDEAHEQDDSSEDTADEAPEPEDTRTDIAPADIENGEVVFNFAAMEDVPFVANGSYGAERAAGADFVTLSGHQPDANPGGRPGIFLDLGEAFEAAAAGQTVQIDALVRLSAPGSFAMAYSTASNGNSGWQTLSADDAFGTISFTYDVPAGSVQGSDFIGVQPDPDNTGQTLDISFIAVTVVE